MTYEDNKKKRSTLPVVAVVRAIASDLCFLDDIQLRTLVFVDGKKVLWFFMKGNNSKTKTMETTKDEMIRILRKLHDLQMWLYIIDSVVKFDIYTSPQDEGYIYCSASCDENISKESFFIGFSNDCSLNDNKIKLGSFIEHVTKLEYECRKSEKNQTPVGKERV